LFITPVPHGWLDAIEPVVRPLEADPALKSAYEAWSADRADFNVRLAALEPGAVAEGWQRTTFAARRRQAKDPTSMLPSAAQNATPRQGKIRRTLSLSVSAKAPSNRGGAPRRAASLCARRKRIICIEGSGARLAAACDEHFRFVPFLLPIGLQEFLVQRPQMG